jgi:ribosomal protein S8
MSFNHSVSDLVATLKNGYLAKSQTVSMPVSKLRDSILTILKRSEEHTSELQSQALH